MRYSPPNGRRWPVAILGATGAVGQTFIRLLADHPWFEVTEVVASSRSEGKKYSDAVNWLGGEMPRSVAGLTVLPTDPARISSQIVFSALDATVAGDVERAFAAAGKLVLSNARNFRMEADVPLVIPEVNAAHMQLLDRQRRERGWSGAIVTNANCAATVAAVALAPLQERFGIDKLFMTTMQAVSGAGYPGVPSLDILGNVIPYIAEEEPKVEREMRKLLGTYENEAVVPAAMQVSAQTNRVAVENGHTVCIAASFHQRATAEQALDALRSWRGDESTWDLPSRPEKPLLVRDEDNRPQPQRDVGAGGGMTVSVGRVRADTILDIRMVALGHNTIRGAAGGSVLNAELLAATGRLGAA
ncbi:MAG: aspartate-semialdehyde dehydrogenase [Gemmatimonadales bacterium]